MWTEWAWRGPGEGMVCEVTRHIWATTWSCHHVACPCGCHDQAQVRQHTPDVMASRYQGLVGLQGTAE